MSEDELMSTLARIEKKMDQVLEFRDMILAFATAGAAKKAAMVAKAKVTGKV
jgi:hypothetical protein